MNSDTQEVLHTLLPDVDPTRRDRARRGLSALQLFTAAVGPSSDDSAAPSTAAAVRELKHRRQAGVVAAIEGLLVHALRRHQGATTFASLAAPPGGLRAAWEQWVQVTDARLRRRIRLPWPAADESAAEVLPAMCRALARASDSTGLWLRSKLWDLRIQHALGAGDPLGEDACVVALRELSGAARERGDLETAWDAAADAVAHCLDRADVAGAGGILEGVSEPVARGGVSAVTRLDALRRVVDWGRARGPGAARLTAKGARRDDDVRSGLTRELESVLESVLGAVPEVWREAVGLGCVPAAAQSVVRGTTLASHAHEGPGVLCWVLAEFSEGGRIRVLAEGGAAPRGAQEFESLHRGGVSRPGSALQHVAATGEACVVSDGVTPDGQRLSLGVEEPHSVAIEPVRRGEELTGFLWIEYSHRLVPSSTDRRAALAAIQRKTPPVSTGSGSANGFAFTGSPDDRHQVAWATRVASLGVKLAERCWTAYRVAEGEWGEGVRVAPVARGGAAEVAQAAAPVEQALRRALRSRTVVRATGGEDLHSAVVIPIADGPWATAALVLHSRRRGDLGDRDVARWSAQAATWGASIRCERMDALDGEVHAKGCWFDVGQPDAVQHLDAVRRLGDSRAHGLIVGERGSGRRSAARWAAERAWCCGGDALGRGGRGVGSVIGLGLTGSALGERLTHGQRVLIIAGVDRMGIDAQGRLADHLASRDGQRVRVLATAEAEPAIRDDAGALTPPTNSGALIPELAEILGKVLIRVPSLRQRRHWIPSLARHLLLRAARAEQLPAPSLTDAGAALLWRQAHPGNAADLDAWLYAALLECGGSETLDVDILGHVAQARGVELVTRIPSRAPDPCVLASVAVTTATAGGRPNKTRAGIYLGWDKSTVASHLAAAGIAHEEDAWSILLGGQPAEV